MNTITTTLRRLGAGTVVAAATVVLTTGAASAETRVFLDDKGDLDHGADIKRVRVVNDEQVRVKVVHRDLVRSYESGSSLEVFLDTDRSRKGPEYVFQGGTFEGADYGLLRAKGWKAANRQAVPMQCGYIMRLDYAKDIALVRIDRECLGDPGRIRVEVKTGGELVPEDSEPATTDVDWLGKPRQFTPWVKRG